MADSTIVSNDAKERVALELLKIIAVAEKDQSKDRAYYLRLMRECVKATAGQGGPTVSAGALKKAADG